MKITRIKTIVVNAKMRNWVFVKVETNQPGLYGWGEITLEWKTRALVGAIEDLEIMLLGENPLCIEHIFQKLYKHSFWVPGVIGMSAISGIEQALWDIKGKFYGVPVFELLGGKVRDKVRMYTHLGGGKMADVYETFEVEPLLALAKDILEKGYTAFKVVFVPYSKILENKKKIDHFRNLFMSLREFVGNEIDIMVDFHGRTSSAMAIKYINSITEFSPFFCEEPVRPEFPDALRRVYDKTSVPIATGERLISIFQYNELLRYNCVDVIQPDLCHCGGLLSGKKIAALAEASNVGVAPHNPLGPIANAVNLHFALSTPNFLIQEDMLADVPWRWEIVETDIKFNMGYWTIPTAPGLGIEVNEDRAKKYPFEQEIIHSKYAIDEDNSILDW